METAEMLRTYEEKLLQTSVRRDAEAVSRMLTDDFREFGSSGQVYSKDQTITALQSESPALITMKNFHAHLLTHEVALVTYTTKKRDHTGAMTESLRSSIWINQSGEWRMLFHQGTRVPTAP